MKDNNNSSSFVFVCKYHVAWNDTWMMDNRICRTQVFTPSNNQNDASSVTCLCNQPVTHAVSLDYIQSTTGEGAGGGSPADAMVTCNNPCGCAPQRKSTKLRSWAKALIGISVSLVVVVIAILLVLLGLFIVKKVLMKRSEEIERKIDWRNVDSPTMALRLCWWWLC